MALPALPQIPLAAPAGYDPRDVQAAQDAMTVEYTPQVNSINQAIQTIQSYLDRDVQAQQKYGEIADQKIAEIGTQLAQTLQGNVSKTQDIYTQGTQQVGAAYDEAAQTLGGLGQQVQQNLQQSASKLGQTIGGQPGDQFSMDPLKRLSAEMDVMKGRVATGKAGATSNLQTLGTQMTAIAQKVVGDEERNTAAKRRDVAANILKTIGELQLKTNESTTELLQKYATLAEIAGPKFRMLLNEAANARTQAERQEAQRQFENQLALAKFQADRADAAARASGGGESALDTQYKQ